MAISSPNYTQFPNELLDVWLGQLTPVEFCALAYIVRHTFGWQHGDKPEPITFNEFLKGRFRHGQRCDFGCGIKSSRTLELALRVLEAKDLIVRTAGKTARGATGTTSYVVKVAPPTEQAAVAAGTLPSKEPHGAGTLPGTEPALYLVQSQGDLPGKVPSLSKKREKEPPGKEPVAGAGAPTLAPAHDSSSQQDAMASVLDPRTNDLDLDELPILGASAPAPEGRPPAPDAAAMTTGGESWLEAVLGLMYTALAWKPENSKTSRAHWRPLLWRYLGPLTTEQQHRFVHWFFSDGYYLENKHMITTMLKRQLEVYVNEGCPQTKVKPTKNGHRPVSPAAFPTREQVAAEQAVERARRGGKRACRHLGCRKLPGYPHAKDCPSGFGGQIVGEEQQP